MSAGTLLAVAHGALLQGWGSLAGAAQPVPSPSPSTLEIPPEDQTSPGLLGFLVTFAAAAAVIFLGFSLVRHLRVVDRNARRLQAEQDATGGDAPRAAGDAPTADGPGATPPPGRP